MHPPSPLTRAANQLIETPHHYHDTPIMMDMDDDRHTGEDAAASSSSTAQYVTCGDTITADAGCLMYVQRTPPLRASTSPICTLLSSPSHPSYPHCVLCVACVSGVTVLCRLMVSWSRRYRDSSSASINSFQFDRYTPGTGTQHARARTHNNKKGETNKDTTIE